MGYLQINDLPEDTKVTLTIKELNDLIVSKLKAHRLFVSLEVDSKGRICVVSDAVLTAYDVGGSDIASTSKPLLDSLDVLWDECPREAKPLLLALFAAHREEAAKECAARKELLESEGTECDFERTTIDD